MTTFFTKAAFPAASFFSSLLLLSSIATYGYSQSDTLYMNNKKIACSIKEITPDAIKFTYPGEELLNTIYKNTVQKVVFKSGRTQTFAEATSYKQINGVMDYDKVAITSVEDEVKGLYKFGEVSSKAKGTTVYSNQERVKERAYRKLKVQAAMFGANVIYLANQRTEGNKYGSYFTSGSTSETDLTGVAYSNTLPDYDQFRKLISTGKTFTAVKKFALGASSSDVSQDDIKKSFEISNISSDNGIIYIDGNLQGEHNVSKFQVVNVGSNSFSIAFRNKGDAYNFTIAL
ncbi:MAG: hypothetical protein JST19_00880 [Bacteroidetes bacterium]|nr:hypothetical protein [Bacteroidota bacterium]